MVDDDDARLKEPLQHFRQDHPHSLDYKASSASTLLFAHPTHSFYSAKASQIAGEMADVARDQDSNNATYTATGAAPGGKQKLPKGWVLGPDGKP